jgi:methionine synthase II (cobalamin-independent)
VTAEPTDAVRFAWPPASATGVGSMPGTDPNETARLVFGELPDLPFLPELPARGAGADSIGRTATLLIDLPTEIQPSGWRFTSRPGRDLRRAADYLAYDLDALAARAAGYTGPLKMQCAGPLTLAACVELRTGHRAVSDAGAVADIAASLAEGVRAHLAAVAAAVPGARPVLQLDEPSLPAVLAGTVPTASGFGTIRAVDAQTARERLRTVLGVGADGGRVVHCCADDVPVGLLGEAGADAVSFDLDRSVEVEALGEAVEAGTSLWLGAQPTSGEWPSYGQIRDRVTALWTVLGFPLGQLAAQAVLTPACGLAGASADFALAALRAVRETGRALRDLG